MSAYTEKMVEQLRNKAEGWNYETATSFAQSNGLSVRSVISKIKSEKLEYIPKAKAISTGGDKVTKADIVAALAKSLGIHVDTIDGLAKADARSLNYLIKSIGSLLEK